MNSKTYLITGASSGIGFEAALKIAKLEPESTLIISARSDKSGLETVENLVQKSGNKNIHYVKADLSSLSEVRNLAKEVLEKFPHLDVLVNNAGVFMSKKVITSDNLEETYAVNYFAPFLLTHLLLDRLKLSKEARIVNVSSVGHRVTKRFRPEQLTDTEGFSGFGNYAASKLALILFTQELAKVLESTTVKVNSLHPGGVATRIARQNLFFNLMMNWFGTSAEKGASPIIFLAQSERASSFNGQYFDKENRLPVASSPLSYKKDLSKDLYHWSLNYFKMPLPGIK